MANAEIKKMGQDLKRFRRASGLSKNALYKKSGISAGAISKLESGDAKGLQKHTKKKIVRLLSNDPAVYGGKSFALVPTQVEVPPMPSMDEVEKALGMDPHSIQNIPPVVMTFGRLEISLRVNP